jgi:hypothetical protein
MSRRRRRYWFLHVFAICYEDTSQYTGNCACVYDVYKHQEVEMTIPQFIATYFFMTQPTSELTPVSMFASPTSIRYITRTVFTIYLQLGMRLRTMNTKKWRLPYPKLSLHVSTCPKLLKKVLALPNPIHPTLTLSNVEQTNLT